jgi:nucleoside-diphosphate-sugar epimerase
MAKFLVTGVSGFIGTHLAARLRAAGHEVVGLVRATSTVEPLVTHGVQLAQADVTDPQRVRAAIRDAQLTEHDVVFHLAGRTRAFSFEHFALVNADGTENVVRACAELPSPPTLIAVSSLAAGGPSRGMSGRLESEPDAPVSNYGRSKLAGDEILFRYADRVPISIVRPTIVFGDGDIDNLPMFRAIRWTGIHIVPRRSDDFPLSLVHVDDLVTILCAVAERGRRLVPGDDQRQGIYYAADPQSSSYVEFGHMAAAAMSQRVWLLRIRHGWLYVPATFGEFTGRILRRPAQMTFDKICEVRAPAWVCSTERIEHELDFQPAAPLAERIRQTAEWYHEEGWL